MTKQIFVDAVKLLVAISGQDPSLYSGHSFRAGSATSASENNFETHEVKQLGRWASDAYMIYLRNPKVVSKFAKRLAVASE